MLLGYRISLWEEAYDLVSESSVAVRSFVLDASHGVGKSAFAAMVPSPAARIFIVYGERAVVDDKANWSDGVSTGKVGVMLPRYERCSQRIEL
jgi:hypothetical protein